MSQVIYSDALLRIASALEAQNVMYTQVNKLNNSRYEEMRKEGKIHDDLISQIVTLNDRLSHMANTIDQQNQTIMEQGRALLAYEKALDREGRDEVDSPG